ncbi:complement C4-B-like [Carcharodon carcharias]|uniref:complement C4-B-like n=1 Tax=Carcharodon carcharias TaxID=13397 RepID=UPI001B7E4B56|nr:complement C4-B-like [Carcharodon carcharias]
MKRRSQSHICMNVSVTLLLVVSALSSLLWPNYLITAPNIIHAGVEETVAIQLDGAAKPVKVKVYLFDLLTYNQCSDEVVFELNAANNYRQIKNIIAIPDRIEKANIWLRKEKYVSLAAECPELFSGRRMVPILLSSKRGYIFIQTDKPIYTPNENVFYRIFTLDHYMRPVKEIVKVTIYNSRNMQFPSFLLKSGIGDASKIKIPDIAKPGNWRIEVQFEGSPMSMVSAQFEVKEFVLPSFKVEVKAEEMFYLITKDGFKFEILAEHTYGKAVEGMAYVRFGIIDEMNNNTYIRGLEQQLRIKAGVATSSLRTEMLSKKMKKLASMADLVGHHLYMAVTVFEASSGEMEEVELRNIKFVSSPYVIDLSKTSGYFVPNFPFTVQVTDINRQKLNVFKSPATVANMEHFGYSGRSGERKSLAVVHHFKYEYYDQAKNDPLADRVQLMVNSWNVDVRTKSNVTEGRNQINQNRQMSHAKVQVTYPDGSPASDVPVKLEGKSPQYTRENGHVLLTMAPPSNTDVFDIKVIAGDGAPGREFSEAKKTVRIYHSKSKSYLYVNVPHNIFDPDSSFPADISAVTPAGSSGFKVYYYLVISKGKVLQMGEIPKSEVTNLPISLSISMVPAARLVLYYYINVGGKIEMVANSVWIDVKDVCEGKITIKDMHKEYKPGGRADIIIKTEDRGQLSLVIVDTAIYVLNNKNKLTANKVFEEMNSYDLGCTFGGGSDSRRVFMDAGLTFISNAALSMIRNGYSCKTDNRRMKRSLDIQEQYMGKLSHYADKRLRSCCTDGITKIPMRRSCKDRAKRVKDMECRKVFLTCCEFGVELRHNQSMKLDTVGRMVEDYEDDFFDEASVRVRSIFPQSWQWRTYRDLPAREHKFQVHIPDSITTWEVQAVGMFQSKGFCVAEPKKMKVFKNFFIYLRLPYSVKRNEQLEVRAIVYNYHHEELKVNVFMKPVDNLCSPATGKEHERTVTVGAKSAYPIYFSVVPLAIGVIPITVIAYVNGDVLVNDAVTRKLNVLAEGVLKTEGRSISIDPRVKSSFEIFEEIPSNVVPDTKSYLYIRARGEVLGETVQNCLSPEGVDRLIQLPSGCTEQTTSRLAPTVFAVNYLDKSDQWLCLKAERKDEAIEHIRAGYKRIVEHQSPDGSYGGFNHYSSSRWLTAYIVKILSIVRNQVDVEKEHIQKSVLYLVNDQKETGEFHDPNLSFRGLKVVGADEVNGDKNGVRYLRQGASSLPLALHLSPKVKCTKVNSEMDTEWALLATATYCIRTAPKCFTETPSIMDTKPHKEILRQLTKGLVKELGVKQLLKEDSPMRLVIFTEAIHCYHRTGSTCVTYIGASYCATVERIHFRLNAKSQSEESLLLMEPKALLFSYLYPYFFQKASISRAINYLSNELANIKRPYALAVTAYALALVDPGSSATHEADEKLKQMAIYDKGNDVRYWNADKTSERAHQASAITIETTSYALLQTVAMKDLNYAKPIVKWLTEQRRYEGGFRSTQDTVVALEALSEYSIATFQPEELDMRFTFSHPIRKTKHNLHINRDNALVQDKLNFPLGYPISIQITGKGTGSLTVLKSYQLMTEPTNTCDYFSLEVTVKGKVKYMALPDYSNYEDYDEHLPGDQPLSEIEWFDLRSRKRRDAPDADKDRTIYYEVCAWHEPDGDLDHRASGMAIVDISLLSGFEPEHADLDKLKNIADRYIDEYEFKDGRVILYLEKVTEQRECVVFGAKQIIPIGLIQPASATLYDYYNPSTKCNVFYNAPEQSTIVSKLCQNDVCECAEGHCPQMKRTFSPDAAGDARMNFACYRPIVEYDMLLIIAEKQIYCRNFRLAVIRTVRQDNLIAKSKSPGIRRKAFIVNVSGISSSGSFNVYETIIIESIKFASDEGVVKNDIRHFIKRVACPMKLQLHQSYLLMGKDGKTKDANRNTQYILDSDSWIEEMPPASKCQATKTRRICEELNQFTVNLNTIGCQM